MQDRLSPEPLVPSLALASGIACVAGAGALANCSLLATLLKSPRNGLSSIIIQLSFADFLILGIFAGELWFYNIQSWTFSSECCIAYRGLREFCSTASSYLVATVALHSLATYNLEEKSRRKKVNKEDDDDEIRSSHHSLVASSDSSTPPRTMKLDYRLTTTPVGVILPTVFIWILAASLSVPQFVSAITVTINEGITLCTSKDSYYSMYMNSLLATFNLFVPVTFMSVAGILVCTKLRHKKAHSRTDISESRAALKLSLCLIILYCTLCVPRSVAIVYRAYTKTLSEYSNSFESEQLSETMFLISFAFTSTYVIVTVIRPILCLFMLPQLREQVINLGSRNAVKV